MGIERPRRVPNDESGTEGDYERAVDLAIDRGLADREANQVKVHTPLVRRRDESVAEQLRRVVWTASAWTSLTTMFGDPLDRAVPGGPLLEVALDKTAYWLTTLPPPSNTEIAELGFMYNQARVMYLVEPGRVVILAVLPSLVRFQRSKGHKAS